MTTRIAYLSSALLLTALTFEGCMRSPAFGFLACGVYILLLAGGTILVGNIPRKRRTGTARLVQQVIGWPLFGGSLTLMLASCRMMIVLQEPRWLLVILFFWILTYLAWKVFLYPNHGRDDGDGDRPKTPRPDKGPGLAKPEPEGAFRDRRQVPVREFAHLN